MENKQKLKLLLAILNTEVFFYFMERISGLMQGHTLTIQKSHMEKFSIPKFDLSDETQKAQHDKIISLVEQMVSAQKELNAVTNDSDKKLLQQKCDLLDKQIDKLVYELYELTEEEIKIVEGASL